MTVSTRLVAVVLGLALVSGTALAGKVYKWVDAKGVTHYGEQPPTAGSAETIKTSSKLPSDHEAAVKNLDVIKKKIDDDAQARVQAKKQKEDDAKAEDVAAQLKKNCDQTRKNLSELKDKARVQMDMPDGSKKILTEEEKQAKVTENETYLKTYCGEGSDKKGKK